MSHGVRSTWISLNASSLVQHNDTLCAALFCKELFAKKTFEFLWREMTLQLESSKSECPVESGIKKHCSYVNAMSMSKEKKFDKLSCLPPMQPIFWWTLSIQISIFSSQDALRSGRSVISVISSHICKSNKHYANYHLICGGMETHLMSGVPIMWNTNTKEIPLAPVPSAVFNLRPAGGGCWEPPPPSVFSRLSKNGGAARRRFWHTLSYIFSAHVVKISDPGHARSGHQVTSSDLTS